MFERYTEKARRTVFFARYEASQFGSRMIETEHFLLGLLREDTDLRQQVSERAVRKMVEARTKTKEVLSTSVDLPLSHETKRVLAYAAEESERMGHRVIDCVHLTLGLLREKKSMAAEILLELGLEEEQLRAVARKPPGHSALAAEPRRFRDLLAALQDSLADVTQLEAPQLVKSLSRSRTQALGHLIDLAMFHHGCLVRALVGPRVDAAAWPAAASAIQAGYDELPWWRLTELCVQIHQLTLHALTRVPPECWEKPCRLGDHPALTLRQLFEQYIARAEQILEEIRQA